MEILKLEIIFLSNMYFVYILKCSDDSLYTWITNNIEKRLKMHNWEIPGGAKYTKARSPVELVYSESSDDRSSASKREIEIKKLTRANKLQLIWK